MGIFQLESTGMREVLKQMKPNKFEDIIALVALYRPGPMQNIPTYNNRKHGIETPEYLHPKIEHILRNLRSYNLPRTSDADCSSFVRFFSGKS